MKNGNKIKQINKFNLLFENLKLLNVFFLTLFELSMLNTNVNLRNIINTKIHYMKSFVKLIVNYTF